MDWVWWEGGDWALSLAEVNVKSRSEIRGIKSGSEWQGVTSKSQDQVRLTNGWQVK